MVEMQIKKDNDAYGEITGEEWMKSHNSPHATEKVNMLKGNLGGNPDIGKYPLGVAMFDSYKYTFPCKNN